MGVRRQEPEDWRRGDLARRQLEKEESGTDQKEQREEGGKMKVTAGFSDEDGSIRKGGEGRGWQCGRAHEVGEGRETDSRRRTCVALESARMGEGRGDGA